jgi:hypothetical protein
MALENGFGDLGIARPGPNGPKSWVIPNSPAIRRVVNTGRLDYGKMSREGKLKGRWDVKGLEELERETASLWRRLKNWEGGFVVRVAMVEGAARAARERLEECVMEMKVRESGVEFERRLGSARPWWTG